MRGEILLLILLMTAVTYIPRALPAFIVNKIKLSGKAEKFLKLIPYTAMASLIFPGIFSAYPGKFYIGVAGGAVAVFLAYRKCPVILCVVAAVAVDYMLALIFR